MNKIKEHFKNTSVSGLALLASALLALIAFIIFIVNSTTGFLAGKSIDTCTLIFSLFYIILTIAFYTFSSKFTGKLNFVNTIFYAVLTLFLCLVIYFFTLSRVSLVADVHFIPVNYPEAEETSLNISIVCLIFYILSFISLVVSGFGKKLTKEMQTA